jgi:serine/threonine protein kinase
VLHIGVQISKATHALEEAGYYHCDIKLENVFFFACGSGTSVPVRVVLGDLGAIRRLRSPPKEEEDEQLPGITSWTPEMGPAEEAGHTTDLSKQKEWHRWCIGLCLLGLLTRKPEVMDDFFYGNYKAHFDSWRGKPPEEAKKVLRLDLLKKANKIAGQNSFLQDAVLACMGTTKAPSVAPDRGLTAKLHELEIEADNTKSLTT